jgi:hypothetical protein
MHSATFIAWLASAMLAWTLPTTQHDEQRARYSNIAEDAVRVAFDPMEPPLFKGDQGRARTATLLLAWASYESDFRQSVEVGQERGDGGDAWCLMQIHPEVGIALDGTGYRFDPRGMHGDDFVRSRETCFRTALHMLRDSSRACSRLSGSDRFSVYATGACTENERASRLRFERAMNWERMHPLPVTDDGYRIE